jgi:SWIM/SEC-C metal-binding protein
MAKLGSSKKPAVARVGTEARAQEIIRICNENGWQVIVGIEPDKPEDISDVKWLLDRRKMEPTIYSPKPAKVGPNDYCPCESGLKYKNCCLRREEGEKRNGP